MTERPWFATYRECNIPFEINADAYRSTTDMLEKAMIAHAARPAFRSFGQTLTYADVDRQSRNFAAYLQNKLGVKKGDRIAVMMPNLLAFPIAFLGIIRAGAVQVNVNQLYTPRELEHQLKDAGVRVMVVFAGSSATVAEVMASTPLKTVITVGPGDGSAAKLPSPPVDPRLSGAIAFADALAEGAKLAFNKVEQSGDDLLFLQYTGGTTGLSKGASLSHRNLIANTEQFKAAMSGGPPTADDVIVTAIPLYHIFALMVNFITYFSVGADNWLVANPRDMDGFIKTLSDARPTVFMGVNTLYAGLVHLTEFSGTTGLPMPSTDIKLLDEEGREVGLGEPGEICARGPQVMSGYWEKPEANAAAFTADGYFRTGDVGVFDSRGFLRIVDRKKDMIIVSGFNVYPNEVEAVATACPGVMECACIGVPDEKTGEAVKLFVVKAANAALTSDELVAHCRKEMTAYKMPKIIEFVDALPKSNVGKILRRELRDREAGKGA